MAKYHPKPVNMAMPQENFAEYYGFDKANRLSPRESYIGMSKWDKKYAHLGEGGGFHGTTPNEHNYMRAKPHGYSCHIGQTGKTRNSGSKSAHRIGKR